MPVTWSRLDASAFSVVLQRVAHVVVQAKKRRTRSLFYVVRRLLKLWGEWKIWQNVKLVNAIFSHRIFSHRIIYEDYLELPDNPRNDLHFLFAYYCNK